MLALAHTQVPDMLTVAVDKKGAYDTINRPVLMTLVKERHSTTTAALVAMVLQKSSVYTNGDKQKIQYTIDVGLAQGGAGLAYAVQHHGRFVV